MSGKGHHFFSFVITHLNLHIREKTMTASVVKYIFVHVILEAKLFYRRLLIWFLQAIMEKTREMV